MHHETTILNIAEGPRGIEIAENEKVDAESNDKCPEIGIKIEGLHIRELVNTGSPCISEEFSLENGKTFQACPKLPVIGHVIKGAIDTKSAKLKIQILAETWIGPEKRKIVYFVIAKLVRKCI